MTKSTSGNIQPDTMYEIRIRGHLPASWSDRLGGMAITYAEDESGSEITTLCGRLLDQATLFGVLNALYNMRFPLIFVQSLD